MPILCRPAVAVPENVITLDETLELARRIHHDHPKLKLALRMIENTSVSKRHLIRPIEETLIRTGFTHRSQVFEQQAKERVPPVVEQALSSADMNVSDIDAIVLVSCTGFMMPSLTAWLINEMGFHYSTTQLPIAQLGCAAGAAAINRAADYCVSHPGTNVLIISCEFCSLCYQPDDLEVGNLLSNGLFGDAVAAAVVSGRTNSTGMRLDAQSAYLIPDTETWIAYDVRDTGFHFMLNKGVPGSMQTVMPQLSEFVAAQGDDLSALDFYAIHTGGPRVLDALHSHGGVSQAGLQPSRDTLTSYGNLASAAVFDVVRRIADSSPSAGERGLIAGFGPGISVELALGTWVEGDSSPASDKAEAGRVAVR